MRRLPPLLLALACLALPAPAAAAPNVVVIQTDDQTVAEMAAMPKTRELIGDDGVRFERSLVSLSACCPSRATFLTGRYAHNHGVQAVLPPFGGFYRLDGSETLPVWLRRAGYATGVVGKYLNGYGTRDRSEVPPGWTEFHGLLGSSTYRFYDYTFNDDGVLRHFGTELADHQTDVITTRSEAFIRRRAPSRSPFFLWTTYVAPHTGRPSDFTDAPGFVSAVPAPRHRSAYLGAPLPRPPSFDEADVSDKPPSIRRRPPLGPDRIAALAEVSRQRRASLLAVDEGVARIVHARAGRAGGHAAHVHLRQRVHGGRAPCPGREDPRLRAVDPRAAAHARAGHPAGRGALAARVERRPRADDPRRGGRAGGARAGRAVAAAARAGPGRPRPPAR